MSGNNSTDSSSELDELFLIRHQDGGTTSLLTPERRAKLIRLIEQNKSKLIKEIEK